MAARPHPNAEISFPVSGHVARVEEKSMDLIRVDVEMLINESAPFMSRHHQTGWSADLAGGYGLDFGPFPFRKVRFLGMLSTETSPQHQRGD